MIVFGEKYPEDFELVQYQSPVNKTDSDLRPSISASVFLIRQVSASPCQLGESLEILAIYFCKKNE